MAAGNLALSSAGVMAKPSGILRPAGYAKAIQTDNRVSTLRHEFPRFPVAIGQQFQMLGTMRHVCVCLGMGVR